MAAKRSSQSRRKGGASKTASARKRKASNDLPPELMARVNALLMASPQLASEIEELRAHIEELERNGEEIIRRSRKTREELRLLQARLLGHAAS